MGVSIRPADFEKDRDQLVQLMLENLSSSSTVGRFDWLYNQNPSGKARAWVAVDKEEDKIVGTASIFPRSLYVGGKKQRGWVLGDFCLSPRYRSLGPALSLQRACLRFLDERSHEPYYDFPSQTMVAVYRRLGRAEVQTMKRAMKPIRVNRIMGSGIPWSWLGTGVSWVGNMALRLMEKKRILSGERTITCEKGPWGEEFSELSDSMSEQYDIFLDRSAAYLNWRFHDNPLTQFGMMVAREHGRIIGYCVFNEETDDVDLIDLFGQVTTPVLGELLSCLSDYARQGGKTSLQTSVMALPSWSQLFREQGFWFRESFPLIVGNSGEGNGNQRHWFLTQGDRES